MARYGFGVPNLQSALESGNHRATMTYDGEMKVDTVVIHPVPIPDDFAVGFSRSRELRIALAFDPPVRRQRREYIAGTMQVDLYKAMDLAAVQAIVARQDSANPLSMPSGRQRVPLTPGSNSLKSTTLQVRSWKPIKALDPDDGDTYFLAVTHRTQTWSRDRDDYQTQRYALAVTLEERAKASIFLHQALTTHVRQPARIRLRS